MGGGSNQPAQQFAYVPNGNIDSKTGMGSYYYGAASIASAYLAGQTWVTGGPHAVTGIDGLATGNVFQYDLDGNQLQGNGRSTGWTSFDMVASVNRGPNGSQFLYGPDHERRMQRADDAGTLTDTYYGGGQEVVTDGRDPTQVQAVKT